MAGRKAAKSGSKKLRVTSDVKKKALKKLKARRPENAVDLKSLTKTKVLNIEARGQDSDRLLKRIMAGEQASQPDDLAADLLLMRDGLLEKRLEGLTRISERVVLDINRIGTWGKRVMQELGPRVVDQERTVRRYAVQIMISLIEGLAPKGKDTLLQPQMMNGLDDYFYSEAVLSHLRTALTSIQESISRDALIYLHQLMMYDNNIRSHPDFVKKIFLLLLPHARLIQSGGAAATSQKKTNKKLWPCVNFFADSLAPVLSDWASLFCGTILLVFCSICRTGDQDAVSVSRILAKLKSPFIKTPAVDEMTSSTFKQMKKNVDDFKEITVPGSDFPLGILINAVDSMISLANTMESPRKRLKLAALACIIIRWVVNISFGEELNRMGELVEGECLPPRTHRTKEFYEVCVSAGGKKKYSLIWLFQNLSLAVTIKNIHGIIADIAVTEDDSTRKNLECLVAETLQAIDVVGDEGTGIRARVHAHLDSFASENPYLGSGRGLVWDTYLILAKIFGRCAVPISVRDELITLKSAKPEADHN